jgi:hypothetical protein
MRSFKKVLTKLAYVLVFLSILSTTGLAFHFHQDGNKHESCSLCSLQSHFYAVAQIGSDPIVLSVSVATLVAGTLFVRSLHYLHSSSRAPPA